MLKLFHTVFGTQWSFNYLSISKKLLAFPNRRVSIELKEGTGSKVHTGKTLLYLHACGTISTVCLRR